MHYSVFFSTWVSWDLLWEGLTSSVLLCFLDTEREPGRETSGTAQRVAVELPPVGD